MTAFTLPSVADLEAAISVPFEKWAHQCHGISSAIVSSEVLGVPCRVARGTCPGVGGQHSWIVLGMDCYADPVDIIDPTLWSYREDVEGVWAGSSSTFGHRPHGAGSIWQYGRPGPAVGDVITLAYDEDLGDLACSFLDMIGPLDRDGWAVLAHAPVGGWPAAEIIEAMARTPKLRMLVPIDTIGMLTDLNPGGAYLPGPAKET